MDVTLSCPTHFANSPTNFDIVSHRLPLMVLCIILRVYERFPRYTSGLSDSAVSRLGTKKYTKKTIYVKKLCPRKIHDDDDQQVWGMKSAQITRLVHKLHQT